MISILATIIALFSFGYSIYTHKQLLPLKKANVVLLESDTLRTVESGTCLKQINYPCDVTVPIIKNIGLANARNISFRIYFLSIDNKVINEMYNDYLINDLPPEGIAKIGYIQTTHSVDGKDMKGDQEIMVFHLKYQDTIENYNNIEHKYFFYKTNIGSNRIISLIGQDYKTIYEPLKNYLKEKNDIEFYKYLKKNPPK